MPAAATVSFPLAPEQRAALLEVLRGGAFRDAPVPADTSHPSTNLRSSENLSSRPSGSKNRQ